MKRTRIVLVFLILSLLTACQSLASVGPDAGAAITVDPAQAAIGAVGSAVQDKPGQPINVALDAKFSASSFLPNYPPENILAQAPDCWAFQGGGPAWFKIDLPHPTLIRDLRFSIDQYQGEEINVMGGQANGDLQQLATLNSKTFDFKTGTMQFTPETPWKKMETIRLEMAESPLFNCWRGLELIGPIPEHAGPPGDINPPVCGHGSPDIIFHHGQVLTMNPAQPTAEAVAIEGNWITAVGSNRDILKLAVGCTELIDLGGHTLMPGFVDAHTHLLNDHADPRIGLSLIDVQDLAFQNGITTIGDPFVTEDFLHELQALDAAGDLRLRTNAYLIYTDNCGGLQGDWYTAYPRTDIPGEKLRVAGIKIFTDGGSCGLPAVSEEFSPGEGLGDLFLTQDQLNTAVSTANAQGYQVVMHAIGDRAVEQAQNALEYTLGGAPNILRHRIDHNSVIRPDLMTRYTDIDAVVAIFGYHTVCGLAPRSPFYQTAEWPWRTLVDSNPDIHIAWHGDDPWVGPISPILEMWNMITRQEVDPATGAICSPPAWLAAQTLTVDEVLPMMTTESAYALFRDDEVGSLVAGKFADMIVLSDNPTTVDPSDIKDISVQMTMVDGVTEYCAAGASAYCP